MLDLNHPQTPFIFEAARLLDALIYIEREMLEVAPEARLTIFEKSQPYFEKLRILNRDRFKANPKNEEALTQLKMSLCLLCQQAENYVENEPDPCPRCGRTLERSNSPYSLKSYCDNCSPITSAAHGECSLGFGTMYI